MNVPLANTAYCLTALGMVLAMAFPAKAEIETGRVLMESHRFEEAMEEFLPAARSGNADAEELIGVMYAMGLGVERDDERTNKFDFGGCVERVAKRGGGFFCGVFDRWEKQGKRCLV